jgi:hypothetical protein
VDNGKKISGQLYKPISATQSSPLPGIVLAHGVTNAKETMNDLALELAKQEFVTLTIDESAHGNSEGQRTLSDDDSTLGVLAGIKYLESLSYIDTSNIGLIGHSMGAGAVREAAYQHGSIKATIFLGGGVSSTDIENNKINATFPKNLLIAIGFHDVLFDLESLQNSNLKPTFNTSNAVIKNTLYGSFSDNSARKLITPSTIHLFEPIDPEIVYSSIEWMISSLKSDDNSNDFSSPLIWSYQIRTAIYIVYLFSILALFIHVIVFFDRKYRSLENSTQERIENSFEVTKIHLFIFSTLSLILFFPLMLVGAIIPIPPVLFGSSLAWWLFGLGILGMLLYYFFVVRRTSNSKSIITIIRDEFDWFQILVVFCTFTIIASVIVFIEVLTNINVKLIIPLFNDLFPLIRIGLFFIFIPFYLVFNFVDTLMITKFNEEFKDINNTSNLFISTSKMILIKNLPFLLIILLQVIPMLMFNIRVFPAIIGFFMEFLYVIIPLLVVASIISIITYRYTKKTSYSILLNTLLFSWISAGLFPLL